MIDIVKRLRRGRVSVVSMEAASEIERLREQVAGLRNHIYEINHYAMRMRQGYKPEGLYSDDPWEEIERRTWPRTDKNEAAQ